MFCCFNLGSEKYTERSTEIFEINLLRTWDVDIESRISPKYAAYAPRFFFFFFFVCFCWMERVLSVLCTAGFGNFRPEAKEQYFDFDPFYTISDGK